MTEQASTAAWGLLGHSAVMEDLREKIRKFGPSRLSIHVHGETGTGKDRVARAIHRASGRPGSFVAFNAAGFTDELVEAELFGHTRGAFTGAVVAREGYVAAAERGTLFLDEIAELSPRGQAKLLRFLEEREYQKLGETATRRADVRVVSATNVDLGRRVEQGRFRQDLWYRLVGQPLHVPPLRERGGDVLFLLHHFLRREVGPGGRPPRLSRGAEDVVVRFRWPGNVRQLATEAQRLAVKASAGVVEVSHLSAEVREGPRVARGSLRSSRQESDRACVRDALERHGGNRTAAAAHLGISRQALVSLIRRLELRIPPARERTLSSPSTDR
ncbi:MAG: sigma-54 dependent transcriptional regulator [Acidobacteria bacterium]|nr:sigma-54 dependent transcriptional regulator [Acidobacteriota bacterium]